LFLDPKTTSREAWITASLSLMIYQRKIFLPIGASTFRGKTESVFDFSPSYVDPFDFAVAIPLVLPVIPTWWRKQLPHSTLPTPTMETTRGAFTVTASGMWQSTGIPR
jgi:hypothetical protein